MYILFAPAAKACATLTEPPSILSPEAGNTSAEFAPLLAIITNLPAAAVGNVTASPVEPTVEISTKVLVIAPFPCAEPTCAVTFTATSKVGSFKTGAVNVLLVKVWAVANTARVSLASGIVKVLVAPPVIPEH